MTKKLYYENVYQKEFQARVISIDGNKVVLDQTCFFPRGGGQIGDQGEINGIKVIDTIKDEHNVIHVLEKESDFKVGDIIKGSIDWDRRHKVMRTHSATHIASCFMKEVFPGAKNASPGIVGVLKDSMDYIMPEKPSPEKLKQVEDLTNDFMSKNLDIRIEHEPNNPEIRVWKCDKYSMHCGGTHVRNTREIGKVRIKKGKKPGAGKERIEVYVE